MKYRILQIIPANGEYVLFKDPTFDLESLKEKAEEYKDDGVINWEELAEDMGEWITKARKISFWALVEQGKATHIIPMVIDFGSNELKPAEELEGFIGLIGEDFEGAATVTTSYIKELLNG